MLKRVQHKKNKDESNSKKYDDVLYDNAHNVLHRQLLLP